MRGAWLSLALVGTALASPATDLFERGYSLLQQHYDGPSTADRLALHARYAAELSDRCADQPSCPLETGRTALGAFLDQLHDPHTAVRDPQAAARLREALDDGQVLRTGLRVKDEVRDVAGDLLVTFVAPGSPAEQAGVRRFDHLTAVNGEPVTATGFATAERRGEALSLSVSASGGSSRRVLVTPTRLRVNDLPTLSRTGEDALIVIPTFLASGTAATFVRLLAEAKAAGARRLVVDLRYNGGGSLNECLAAASAFGPVTYRSAGKEGDFTARAEGGQLVRRRTVTPSVPLWTGGVAVLTGDDTASCSEVFTWALGARAVTVGEPTKGALNSAVDFYDLPGGNLLSVSTSHAEDASGQPLPTRIVPQIVADQEPTPQRDATFETALKALSLAGSAP